MRKEQKFKITIITCSMFMRENNHITLAVELYRDKSTVPECKRLINSKQFLKMMIAL